MGLRHALFAGLAVLHLLKGGHLAEAQTGPEKFGLTREDQADTLFEMPGTGLAFTTAAPDRFIWNDSAETPPEFIPAALFSEFEQVSIGYDPVDRDRYEVRIYRATIFPDRVALAADYAALFARLWGRRDFGLAAHSPVFGEVLGGDDSSGVMKINRITVIRQQDELLILRQTFDASRFETYAADIARLVGSVRFRSPRQTELAGDAAVVTQLSASPAFETRLPGHWSRIVGPEDYGNRGVYELWKDDSDPLGNLGLLLAAVPAPADRRGSPAAGSDLASQGNTAAAFANLLLENLLPGRPFHLEAIEVSRFADLTAVTAFNGHYAFKAEIGEDRVPAKVAVILTFGHDGQTIVAATISPAPQDLYLAGTDMHATYIQALQIEAMTAHFTALANQ